MNLLYIKTLIQKMLIEYLNKIRKSRFWTRNKNKQTRSKISLKVLKISLNKTGEKLEKIFWQN